MRVLLLSFAGILLALLAGTTIYVLGSYFLLRGHAEPRAWRLTVSEMLRELVWAIGTSPLLPLYYVLGRRLQPGEGAPIVVVHGYMQNRGCFAWLARRLRRDGLGPIYGFNYPWYRSIGASAESLAAFVRRVSEETGAARVVLIAHSMGGLVALDYLLHHGGSDAVSKCVTIASPHSGVVYRGPLLGAASRELREGSELVLSLVHPVPIPVLSIASSHDNLAYPSKISSLLARGGIDEVFDGPGHLAILFDERVVKRIEAFLAAEPAKASAQRART